MPKKSYPPTPEAATALPGLAPPSRIAAWDTHCHILTTYATYRTRYLSGAHLELRDFIAAYFGAGGWPGGGAAGARRVEGVVDVWCEAPVLWNEFREVLEGYERGDWAGVEYRFVMGVHPHNARNFTDAIEGQLREAASHQLNVGIGEIGLDYHYDRSPQETQREVFTRQLRLTKALGKPVTVHSREADEDSYRILTEELPPAWKIHVHCFTDSPDFASKLLRHFPNLHIGITGVATFASNPNTRAVIAHLATTYPDAPLRILLETDSPYMVPATLPLSQLGLKSGQKMPFSHSAMIPWTAEYVAQIASEAAGKAGSTRRWDADAVMREARSNAKLVYGV